MTGVVSGIDGYVKIGSATEQSYGEDKQRAVRLQLLWDGISALDARYFIERSGLDSTPEDGLHSGRKRRCDISGLYLLRGPRGPMTSTYRPVDELLSTSNHTAQGLTLTWKLLPALTVQSLTGYRTLSANEYQDYAEFYGNPEERPSTGLRHINFRRTCASPASCSITNSATR